MKKLNSRELATHFAAGTGAQQGKGITQCYLIYLAISLSITIYQFADFQGALRHGLVVPDSILDGLTFDNFRAVGTSLFEVSSPGLTLFYGWLWAALPQFCFIINAILIWIALRISRALFCERLGLGTWAYASILFNPYIYLVASGPNKEIPLLTLTLSYAYVLLERPRHYLLYALLIAATAFFIRDGYGVFLALYVVICEVFLIRSKLIAAYFFAVFLCASTFYSLLASALPFMERNYEVGQSMQAAAGGAAVVLRLDQNTMIGGFMLYILRAAYNFLSWALLPTIFNTNRELFATGLAYWAEGELILVTILACFYSAAKQKQKWDVTFLGMLCLSTWLMISVSFFTQPRYLIPILPLSFAVFAAQSREVRWWCVSLAVSLTLTTISVYYLLGRSTLSLSYTIEQFSQPSFLTFS